MSVRFLELHLFMDSFYFKNLLTNTPNYHIIYCIFQTKDNSNLKNPIIGTSIKTIPKGLFENCTSLDMVNIPITVDFISQKSFAGCPLKEVNVRKAMVQRGAFDPTTKIYKHK